ncbi:MAG: DNA repair protein RecO [Clostridia bacterium]
MTDEKVKGIVVKLIDYKDADRLASIFTLENGLISAKFTGVRRDKAKLKGVAQPFTFAEFNILSRSNNRSIISADILDNFTNILTDYNKTMCGYIVLDMIRSILPHEKREEDIFLLTLSSLKDIEENNEYVATIKYVLRFLDFSGMEIMLPESDYVYFDSMSGEFSTSRSIGASEIDKKVYKTLRDISLDQEIVVADNTLRQILRLLHNVIYIRFGEDIKSFAFI